MKKRLIHLGILTLSALAAAVPLKADVSTTDPRYADPSTVEDHGALSNPGFRADNTKLNIRDRDRESITPLDQGTSREDIEMTAVIRRELVADKRLSMDAKNVKVITIGGKVVLRGPVKTSEEKRIVSEIAGRVANPDYVDDQTDVIENV